MKLSLGVVVLICMAACSFFLGRLLTTAFMATMKSKRTSKITTTAFATKKEIGTRTKDYQNAIHQKNDIITPTSPQRVSSASKEHDKDRYYLAEQIEAQHSFQSLLFKSQHPMDCNATRYLVRDGLIPAKDGFASEFQYINRILQCAVSTQRILLITTDWISAYAPTSCTNQGWSCLWQPSTNCTNQGNNDKNGNDIQKNSQQKIPSPEINNDNPLSFGILPKKYRSKNYKDIIPWFDPIVYGPRTPISSPFSFPFKSNIHHTTIIDIIPHWERLYGRYWVRSQMAHYLWKPNAWLSQQIMFQLQQQQQQQSAANDVLNNGQKYYIGFHIRYTDNIPDLRNSFGRNATQTRNIHRFMGIAKQIQQDQKKINNNMIISTIYVATDNSKVIDLLQQHYEQWTFVSQSFVQRSTTQQRIWFKQGRSTAAGAMALDLEILRRANYLVGSFQSNVYRLACQLNTAYHVYNYSIHEPRHYTVDVEWYEDP